VSTVQGRSLMPTRMEVAANHVVLRCTSWLARPEGFEPPTLRSEVRSNPFSQAMTSRGSPLFRGERAFLSIWFRLVPSHCGNKFEARRQRFLPPRMCRFVPGGGRDGRTRRGGSWLRGGSQARRKNKKRSVVTLGPRAARRCATKNVVGRPPKRKG